MSFIKWNSPSLSKKNPFSASWEETTYYFFYAVACALYGYGAGGAGLATCFGG